MSTTNEKNGGVKFDDFISKIIHDPTKPTGHTLLKGFIGASSEQEHVRIYFDESLNYFIDVPEKAIVHSQELSNSPLGGSQVWIRADAEYTFGDPSSDKRAKKKFFDGPIYQQYVTSYVTQQITQQITQGAGTDGGTISFQYCATQDSACPTQSSNCSDLCPSFQYCPSTNGCDTPIYDTGWYQQIAGANRVNALRKGAANFNPGINRYATGKFNFNPAADADGGTISFQYCATQDAACPTQSSNCSELCPSFQYCPSTNGCDTQNYDTGWYQRIAGANRVNPLRKGAANFNPGINRYATGKFNFNPAADTDGGPISFQYCATQDGACPTQSANCSDLCPSFQYCPSSNGCDTLRYDTGMYQANNPVFIGGNRGLNYGGSAFRGNAGFNPYRG
ncbi:MAG: hypothetical protein ACXVJD_00025 [Mucilaginibacter sp.]